jgi:hypothetical protein
MLGVGGAFEVTEGRHTLTVKSLLGRTETLEVNVAAGETAVLDCFLNPSAPWRLLIPTLLIQLSTIGRLAMPRGMERFWPMTTLGCAGIALLIVELTRWALVPGSYFCLRAAGADSPPPKLFSFPRMSDRQSRYRACV